MVAGIVYQKLLKLSDEDLAATIAGSKRRSLLHSMALQEAARRRQAKRLLEAQTAHAQNKAEYQLCATDELIEFIAKHPSSSDIPIILEVLQDRQDQKQ